MTVSELTKGLGVEGGQWTWKEDRIVISRVGMEVEQGFSQH